MNRSLKLLVLASCLSTTAALAQDPLREIYPYKPYSIEEVRGKVIKMTEDPRPLMNVIEMERRGLMEVNAKAVPWGGYFWALIQGQIANTYQDKSYFTFWEMLGWEGNVKRWKKRRVEVLNNVMELPEKDLAELAPSEKYDLLMGDTNFDLTSRVWQFVEGWGNSKKWGFLSSIDIPAGYRLPKSTKLMALWEGICHGWALAATGYPRAENTVTITLPNGKRMPFYPDDIKALVSLLFANSTVQDNVVVEGLRCLDKNVETDEFGRNVDRMPKKDGEEVLPRCADVHPAVWHASVVNLTGLQGRAFVVEVDYHATVNNHPLSGYKYKWFNPKNGKKGNVQEATIDLAGFKDAYASARSPLAVKLVGVEMEMIYTDWTNPKENETNSNEDDKFKSKKFMYDLELDANDNIVGGQWRADKVIAARGGRSFGNDQQEQPDRILQPDFFWALPKNFAMYFKPLALEPWNGKGQTPQSWSAPAKAAHGFIYNVTREFGFNEKCTVIPEEGKQTKEVPCEFKYPRPQPLINVVNQLLQMSKR